MGNIYIETDENFRVVKTHRIPFDPNNGMGYSREELEKKGFFVEEIPEPIHKVGKRSIMMYNPDTKSIYYEYANIPLSEKERLDHIENALNFINRNSIYGIIDTSTMSIAEEPKQPELNKDEKKFCEYLASQIIAGKMELEDCILPPHFIEHINDTLKDNGIQV